MSAVNPDGTDAADAADATDPYAVAATDPARASARVPDPYAAAADAAADRYRQQHKAKASEYAKGFESVMTERQAAVERANRILDETAEALRKGHTGEGFGQVNVPLMQFAAGMLRTKPGTQSNFANELGGGFAQMAPAIQAQRMNDDEYHRRMLDLTIKRSEYEQEPLKDRAALLKAQQLQEEKAGAAIEVAQLKAGAAGSMSDIAKVEADYLAGRITREQRDAKIKKLTNIAPGAPREEKLYDRARADFYAANPNASPTDFPSIEVWMAEQKGRAAAATETGKSAAEAAMAMPKLVADAGRFGDTVDRILELERHIDKIVGPVNGRLSPSLIFNTDAQALLNYIEELKSQQFGTAAATMRGLGALSNAEGEKIQAAVGRLNRWGDPKKFIEDLKRIRESTVKIAGDLARQQIELGKRATGTHRDRPADTPADTPAAGGLVKGADGVWRLVPGEK